MGEYAYDFTGENVHDGASRNPHDVTRMSGGSSGGSGAAVGGGLVPLALGSDTNGSIRVPSSFCGIFGLKPTYGRLSRARSFPFVVSLDHLGPFARCTRDLALSYDAMQGYDPARCRHASNRPVEPSLPHLARGIDGLRIAVAGGYFRKGAYPEALQAIDACCQGARTSRARSNCRKRSVRARRPMSSPPPKARRLHLDRLRQRANDFDPAMRDRLIAGAMIPSPLVMKAQKFRRWYREQVLALFKDVDVILAPATPCTAPAIGQQTFMLDGVDMPVRPNIGIYTQPISFIGSAGGGGAGSAQAAADRRAGHRGAVAEDIALRVAQYLEDMGAVVAPRPPLS